MQATMTMREGKATYRLCQAGDFPMESHIHAISFGKFSAGIGNPCNLACSSQLRKQDCWPGQPLLLAILPRVLEPS